MQDEPELLVYAEADPADIARRLATCASRWDLAIGGRMEGGFRCEVYEATTREGDEAVVKLAPTRGEAIAEAGALRAWGESGVAGTLRAASPELSALLLDRIRPGTALQIGDEPMAIDVVADLLARLHRPPPRDAAFWSLDAIYPALERRAYADVARERECRGEPDRAEAGVRLLAAARRAAMELCTSTAAPVLLHGDLSAKNFLWNGKRYLAIDPIPRLGDPASDVGYFAANHPPASGIFERAVAIAERLGLDPSRALRWAAVWTVHEACQAWRDDQDELDAIVAGETARLLRAE